MTPAEAQKILALWKPGIPPDPDLAQALDLASRDPGLARWFLQHREFQTGTRDALRTLQPPTDLASRLLAQRRLLRPSFALRPEPWLFAAAAAVVLFLALRFLPGASRESSAPDFDIFRGRMVRAVLREYRMDVLTNDLPAIRSFLAQNAAPADFELSPALAQLPPTGCGLLSWQGQPVSMVCLDGGNLGTLFLFIAPSNAFTRLPEAAPHLEQVSQLGTASWTRGPRTYVLAAHRPPSDLRPLL